MPSARRCLAVTYGGGHANMALPVIRELDARGWDVTALGATTAGPQLRAAGIPAVGYRDLLRPGDDAAIADGERLAPASHDPTTGIALDESIAYLGLSYRDLVERIGADEAAARYERFGRHALLPLGPMRRAIDRWRPDVVITTNSPKSERAALVAAAERSIPTLALEDLLGIRQRLFPEFVPTFRADRVCACSSIAIEHLAAQGTDPASVRITGNPAFDALAHIGASAIGKVRESLGIGARRTVLVTTGAFTDLAALGRVFTAFARTVPDVEVAIRRHPTRRTVDPAPILAAAPGRIRLAEDVAVQPLLAAVDALVTVSSTTAVEAILLGVPVIQLGPEMGIADEQREHVDDLPLYRYGAAIVTRSDDELASAVRDALDGDLRRQLRTRTRELFPPPGDAAQRVADEVVAIAT